MSVSSFGCSLTPSGIHHAMQIRCWMNGNLLVIVVKIMAIAATSFLDVLADADDGETGNEEE